jgi:hypothetical protein
MTIYNKLTQEEFILRSNNVHDEFYDYSLVVYQNTSSKVKIICPIHGVFEQRPNGHLLGKGCDLCARKTRGRSKSYSQDEILHEFKRVHGDKFDYSKVIYFRKHDLVTIGCPEHGYFQMSPYCHLKSVSGCRACSRAALSRKYLTPREELINRCHQAHGNRYGYSLFPDDVGTKTKVPIICPIHGVFYQELKSHLNGCHCPRCRGHMTSSMSKEWLDSLGVPVREFTIGGDRKFVADGYDPLTNTIYEFHGDYWHGNPLIYESSKIHPTRGMTFGEIYNLSLERDNYIRSHGFSLVIMWESDWKIHLKTLSTPFQSVHRRRNGIVQILGISSYKYHLDFL